MDISTDKIWLVRTATLAFTIMIATTSASWAQDDEATADDELTLEEVIVTASRREESMQDVAIAVTAFTADDLLKIGALSMQDVARHTPGLYFEKNDTLKSSRTTIRGIGSGQGTAGADPSVAYYIDEVYLGGPVGNVIDLFDIERVESMAGVINITSKKPTDELTAYAHLEYGNFDHKLFKGTVSGPLIEGTLAASFSAGYYDRGGVLDNVYLNKDVNDISQKGARIGLLYTPSDKMEFLFSLDYREADQTAKAMETLINDPFSIPGAFGALLNEDPYDRKVYSGFAGAETLDNAWGASLRATFAFNNFDFISVTGYRTHEYFNSGESDHTPFGVGRNNDPEEIERFTQEFRWASTGDGALQWIAGLFYYDQNSINDGQIMLEQDLIDFIAYAWLGLPFTYEAPLWGGALAEMDAKSYSAFGSVSYDFSEKFSGTFGLRYTLEEKSIDVDQQDFEEYFFFPLVGGTFSKTDDDDWDAFTPSLTLTYDIQDDVMTYGTISRGFKGGGFNDGLGSEDDISFDPEYMWNYELGLKSTWLDNTLRFNAALFYMDWDDIQIRSDNPDTPNNFDPVIINAGKAHSSGLELEMVSLVSENFTLDANLSWSFEAEFDDGELPSGQPLDQLLRVPEYTLGINADYSIPISDSMSLGLRGEFLAVGKHHLNLDQSRPEATQDAYNLWNARITLAPNSGKWHVALWGKNLTDEDYNVGIFDLLTNPFVGQYFNILGNPRTYGVEFRIYY
jgi:iron complex outermembrane receptor protein